MGLLHHWIFLGFIRMFFGWDFQNAWEDFFMVVDQMSAVLFSNLNIKSISTCWLIRMIEMLPCFKNLFKVSSIYLAVVLLSTIRKLVSPLVFLSPIPANRKPVTVSSSPMTAIKLDPFPGFIFGIYIYYNIIYLISHCLLFFI